MEITPKMIEAGARAWAATSPSSTGGFESMSSHRQWLLMMRMRAALEAALGEKSEPACAVCGKTGSWVAYSGEHGEYRCVNHLGREEQ